MNLFWGWLLGLLSGAQVFLINSFWGGRLDSFRAVAWTSCRIGCLTFFLDWLLGLLSGAQDFLINSFWDGRLYCFRAVAWGSSGVGRLNFVFGGLLELLFGLVAWTSSGRPSFFFNQLLLGWALGLLSGGCSNFLWGWLFELLLELGCLTFFLDWLLGLLPGAQVFLINSFWDGRLDSFRAVA